MNLLATFESPPAFFLCSEIQIGMVSWQLNDFCSRWMVIVDHFRTNRLQSMEFGIFLPVTKVSSMNVSSIYCSLNISYTEHYALHDPIYPKLKIPALHFVSLFLHSAFFHSLDPSISNPSLSHHVNISDEGTFLSITLM